MAVEQVVAWLVSPEAKFVVEISVSIIANALCHTLINGYRFS